MAASTLTSKGQVTIPKEVRERLGLKEGDRLHHLAGERRVTVEEMNEAVKRRAAERFKRLFGGDRPRYEHSGPPPGER